MAEIHLHVSVEKLDVLTVDQCVILESPDDATIKQLRDLVVLFMVGEDKQPLPISTAKKTLGGLTARGEFVSVVRDLYQAIRGFSVGPKGES